VLNLTDMSVQVELEGDDYTGKYKNVFNDETISFTGGNKLDLTPWQYLVYER
jgi:hypothetical protein